MITELCQKLRFNSRFNSGRIFIDGDEDSRFGASAASDAARRLSSVDVVVVNLDAVFVGIALGPG